MNNNTGFLDCCNNIDPELRTFSVFMSENKDDFGEIVTVRKFPMFSTVIGAITVAEILGTGAKEYFTSGTLKGAKELVIKNKYILIAVGLILIFGAACEKIMHKLQNRKIEQSITGLSQKHMEQLMSNKRYKLTAYTIDWIKGYYSENKKFPELIDFRRECKFNKFWTDEGALTLLKGVKRPFENAEK